MSTNLFFLGLIIMMLSTFEQTSIEKQKFIQFAEGMQSLIQIAFFEDVNYIDGFYVDIGGFDPYMKSNTHHLYLKKWKGIVVQPNPIRMARFYWERPNQIHLNFACGSQDTYLTLHQTNDDSMATVSQNVALQSGYKKFNMKIKVPSLSLSQICSRFYHKNPLFMNIDVEGYGSAVLQSNNWSNPKCRPDIIFSQNNRLTKLSLLTSPRQIMIANKYKPLFQEGRINQIYIRQDMFNFYKEKYEKNLQKLKQKYYVTQFNYVANTLKKQLNLKTKVFVHYERQKDDVNYCILPENTPLVIKQVNQNSNRISRVKNKLIVVINFNFQKSYVILNQKYTISQLKLGILTFQNLTIFQDNFNLTVLILETQEKRKKDKHIIRIKNEKQILQGLNQTCQKQKVDSYQLILKQINKKISKFQDNLTNKIQAKNVFIEQNQKQQNEKYLLQINQLSSKLEQIKFILLVSIIIFILYITLGIILKKKKEELTSNQQF